jgi:hypothetical protein
MPRLSPNLGTNRPIHYGARRASNAELATAVEGEGMKRLRWVCLSCMRHGQEDMGLAGEKRVTDADCDKLMELVQSIHQGPRLQPAERLSESPGEIKLTVRHEKAPEHRRVT